MEMENVRSLVGDMPVGGWIDRLVPAVARPYLRLMRLDRPIGTWLLLLPCWWSIALAGADLASTLRLMALFAVGAVVMRGAGCTYNDIVDRDFDAKVARTAARPIPSGAVSPRRAALFLGAQLLIGLVVLVQLDPFAVGLGFASMALVLAYPFMKRVTYWPQAWLGLTFNWGALVGWGAVRGTLDPEVLALYAAGFFWTLGYDTIYAHQDKEDDVLIGVKSTALALGNRTRPALFVFYGLTIAFTALAGWLAGLGWVYFPLMALASGQLIWQAAATNPDDGTDCLSKFRSNRFYGWLLLLAIAAGRFL